jgi:hypothetical protein
MELLPSKRKEAKPVPESAPFAYGIRLMRSPGVPEGRERLIEGRDDGVRKIDNLLPSRLAPSIVFHKGRQAGLDFESMDRLKVA